jgi:Spy/CpxP family protein refolding chaperone
VPRARRLPAVPEIGRRVNTPAGSVVSHTVMSTCAFRRMVRGLLVAVVLAGTVGPSGATQGSDRHKWWLSDSVKSEIGLTDRQSQEVEAIFQSVRPALRAGWERLDRLEQEVSRLMTEGATDEAGVSAAIDRAESARADLNKTRTLMLFRMYRVLTPEQRVRLKAYHERHDQERRSSARGGSRQP